MSAPVIITVAITGAVPRKKNSPAVPITPNEQIEFYAPGIRGRRFDRSHSRSQLR